VLTVRVENLKDTNIFLVDGNVVALLKVIPYSWLAA